MKSFEYSLLGTELKKHTGIVGKQYQMLDKIFSSYKDIKKVYDSFHKKEIDDKTLTKKKYNKLNVMCNKFSFYR